MRKSDSHIFVGMKRDLSPSRQEDKYLWEAHNIRVKPIDSNNTMGSLTNEKGNKRVVTNRYAVNEYDKEDRKKIIESRINGAVLGYCSYDKYLVLFVHNKLQKEEFDAIVKEQLIDQGEEQYRIENYIFNNAKYDKIYRIEFVDTQPDNHVNSQGYPDEYGNGHIVTLLYEGALNFSMEHPIECFMIKESEYIYKAYWIDGINQLRCINITKDQLIEKYLNRTETNKAAKEDMIRRGFIDGDTPFYYSRDVYTTRNPFDIGQECDLREKVNVTRRDDLTGIFPPCTIQYALSYYNKYGSETNLIYVSPIMNASCIDRGGKPNEQVSCSFQIDVQNIQRDFDYLRLYSIKRTIQNGPPETKIVDELTISDISQKKSTAEYGVNDDPLMIPIINSGEFDKDKINIKLDTGFAEVSNIDEIEDTITIQIKVPLANKRMKILGSNGITYEMVDISSIKLTQSGYNFRVTQDEENNITYITPIHERGKTNISYITYNTDLSYTFYDSNTYGEIIDFKQFVAKNRTIIIPKTMAHFENNLFLGNYDYKIDDIRQVFKSLGYFQNSTIKSDEKPTLDKFKIKFSKRSIDLNDTGKNKKYSYSNQLKYNTSYLKWNENYRLGFQCQDKYGKWSDPIWINDIGDGCETKNNSISNRPTLEQGILTLPYPYIDFTIGDKEGDSPNVIEQKKFSRDLMHDLYNNGYRTIRPVVVFPRQNDKHVVAQGIITPSVFNDILRVRNAPYVQPSWFIRPIMPIHKTDFGGMKFLEYRNMRPLQSARSFTFYKIAGEQGKEYASRFYYSAKQVVRSEVGNIDVLARNILGVESTFLSYLAGTYFREQLMQREGLYNYSLNAATYVGNEPLVYNNRSTASLKGAFNFDRKYCEIQNTDLLYPFNFQYIYRNLGVDSVDNNLSYITDRNNFSLKRYDLYGWLFKDDDKSYTQNQKDILALNKLASLALKGRYRVDQSIQTFHSPDIEFDEALRGLYFGNYDIQIDGVIPITDDNVSNYKELQTETATIGTGIGFTQGEIDGMQVTDALYNDSAVGYRVTKGGSEDGAYEGYPSGKDGFLAAGSASGNWYVYPWQKHGSITNDANRGPNGGVKTSELKLNQTSSLKFLDKVLYFNDLGKDNPTAEDLPVIRGNMYFADRMIETIKDQRPIEEQDDILGSLCFAEAQIVNVDAYQAIKIDDQVYFGNIDQANQLFDSISCDPYEICVDTGCPNVWKGSLFVWDGKTSHTDDNLDIYGNENGLADGFKGMMMWGDIDMRSLDRTSGWAYPGFALNTTPNTGDVAVLDKQKDKLFDYVSFFNVSGNNDKFEFPYFDNGFDMNNDSVRIKYKTTPHLVFKFKQYGKKMLDSIFTPDPYIVAISDIQANNTPRRPAVRVHAITQSYIESFNRDEKKGKKGEDAFNLATNQRAIINVGNDFTYGNTTYKHNHVYFYTGEGSNGYGFCTNVFDPGTLFVDQNDQYYVLKSNISEQYDYVYTTVQDGRFTIASNKNYVKNEVEPFNDTPDIKINLQTEPTVAGYEWDKRNKKWDNVINSLEDNRINDWTQYLLKDKNDNAYLFQVSIINNRHEALFGGTTEYAIENNIWVPANTAQPIDLENGVKLQWLYGDTWYQRYDCLRTYQNTPEDENQVTEIVSFMTETNINIDGRYDRNRGCTNNTVMTPQNFNLINYAYTQQDNFFSYKILDGDTYKNVTYPTTVIWSLEKHDSSMIDNFSQITELAQARLDSKMGEITDIEVFNNYIYIFQKKGFSRLKYNDTIQLSTMQGTPIEIANSGKVDGYEVQNSNIGCSNKWSVLVTDDLLYFVDSFTGYIYVIPDGQQARKHAQALSTASSFDTWCRKYYTSDSWKPQYQWDDKDKEYKMIYSGIRTLYDSFNGNIYFTANYRDVNDEDDDKQLMFCKPLMSFESYMPYWKNTVGMFNIDDGLYTITTKTQLKKVKDAVYSVEDPSVIVEDAVYKEDIVSDIWQMWKGEYNKFYDKVEPYSITFVSNKGKGQEGLALLGFNKIFDNLSFIADVKEDDDNKLIFQDYYEQDGIRQKEDNILEGNDSEHDKPHLIHDGYGKKRESGDRKDLRKRNILKKPFDHIRVWNEYQDSTMIPLNFNMLKASNLKQYERIWRVQLPRDKRYKLQRISNPWAYITLAKYPNAKPKVSTDGYRPEDSDNFRMELHNVDVEFFIRS